MALGPEEAVLMVGRATIAPMMDSPAGRRIMLAPAADDNQARRSDADGRPLHDPGRSKDAILPLRGFEPNRIITSGSPHRARRLVPSIEVTRGG